jgi:hypothetical protein
MISNLSQRMEFVQSVHSRDRSIDSVLAQLPTMTSQDWLVHDLVGVSALISDVSLFDVACDTMPKGVIPLCSAGAMASNRLKIDVVSRGGIHLRDSLESVLCLRMPVSAGRSSESLLMTVYILLFKLEIYPWGDISCST